jgi:flagellar assembly protein FliH
MAVHGEQLKQLIDHFAHPLQSLNDEIEQQLKLLPVTLAQQLVRREIRQEPGEIIALIRESLPLLPAASRKIRIYLHPEDAELVRNALQLDDIEDQENWKLIEDPMISRGGCEIKSEKSVINATLENRLQSLAASVLGGERINDQQERKDKSKTRESRVEKPDE